MLVWVICYFIKHSMFFRAKTNKNSSPPTFRFGHAA